MNLRVPRILSRASRHRTPGSGTITARALGAVAFVCAATVCTVARGQDPAAWENRRTILVHIDSPEQVVLEGETGDKRDPFYSVCTSPCDQAVLADGGYRISGDSARPSRRFTLAQGINHETIAVKPASRTAFAVGVVSLVIGAAAEFVGAWTTLGTSFSEGAGGSDVGHTVGLALMGGGLGAIAGGVVLLVVNNRSRVTQSEDHVGQVTGPQWLRAQAWREGEPDGPRDAMPVGAVPLMHGVF